MIENLGGEVYKLAGGEFNINSPKQLGEILFNKMKLVPTKENKDWIFDRRFCPGRIECTASNCGENSRLQEAYEAQGYVCRRASDIDKSTNRKVHTSFNQTVAATGRLSSSDPGLQNIPIRGEMGKEIRKAFVPGEKGWVMVSADYSQIELRIMAHICRDEGLIEAFSKHEDIHRTTASKVFGVPADKVTSDMRRKAKEVNFGLLYGIRSVRVKDPSQNFARRSKRSNRYIFSKISSRS